MMLLALTYLAHLALAIPAPAKLSQRQDACPKNLPALPGFEFPHLIVPISKAHPDVSNPNTYFPIITADNMGTVFNFDIIRGDEICELGFYFPRQDQLETSSFTFNGPYTGPATFNVQINQLGTGAQDGVTTWNNQPPAGSFEGFPRNLAMQPGKYYQLWTGVCPAGLFSMTISSPDSTFCWFQDYNPCPIGPYITYKGPANN